MAIESKEHPQEEYSYGMNPASQINLNINLTELPKCHANECQGVLVPVQATTNPKSLINTIFIAGWICTECGKNFSYNAGKFYKQEVIIEKESPL
jgi:isocitrate lyase